MNNSLKRIIAILGLILILCSIACGICIVIFSFKFMSGKWLGLGKYILAVLSLGLSGMFIAFAGINLIKILEVSDYDDIDKVKHIDSNPIHEEPSVKWKVETDYIKIPEANPININVSPEELKDIAAIFDVDDAK